MMLQTLLTIVLLSCGDAAVVHRRDARSPFLNLRGGAKEERQKSLLVAQTGKKRFGGLPAMDKVVDTLLAGVGLAGTFAVMGAVEAKFGGVKLFVPPMSERQHPIVKMP
jgi:hypothetical protein